MNRRIVMFQWVVIAALVIGAGIGAYLLMNKTNDLQTQLDTQNGNLDSLRSQLKQAKASPTPTPGEQLPAATNNVASPTPTVKATATPKPTPTLKPTSNQ